MSNYYLAYGLTITSDLQINELLEVEKCNDTDVKIKIGKVPERMKFPIEETDWYQAKEDELIFTAPNVAKYYVHHGREIIIEPLTEEKSLAIRVYLLGTAFGAILLQRGRVPFHGGGLSINNKGIIITGESGAGKSTVTNALMRKGHDMVTDDVVALEIDGDNKLLIYPSYPKQKLWNDSAKHMEIDINQLSKIDGVNDKYYVPVEKFCYQPTELKAVFELKPIRCQEVFVEELTGREQLEVLLNHTYRSIFIQPFGLMKAHFLQCVEMTKMIKVYRLYRPENEFTMEEQVKSIEYVLNRLGGE